MILLLNQSVMRNLIYRRQSHRMIIGFALPVAENIGVVAEIIKKRLTINAIGWMFMTVARVMTTNMEAVKQIHGDAVNARIECQKITENGSVIAIRKMLRRKIGHIMWSAV